MSQPRANTISSSRTATVGASGAITWTKEGAAAYNAANPLEPPVAAGDPRDCTGLTLYVALANKANVTVAEWSAAAGFTGTPPRGLEWIDQSMGTWSWKPREDVATATAGQSFYQVWLLDALGNRENQTDPTEFDVKPSAAPRWPRWP